MVDTSQDRNMDAEFSLIGAICIDSRIIERVQGKVNPDDFISRYCAAVFEAAVDADSRAKAWDLIMSVDTLIPLIGENEASRFIRECMEITPTCVNAELHAAIIHKHADTRRLKQAVDEALERAEDAQSMAGELLGICNEYLQGSKTTRLKTLSDALKEMYDGGKERTAAKTKIDTGFPRLDEILKGIWGGNLCLIGARPGVGKSAFALDIARTAAKKGNRVLIYSFEMLADEVAERLIAEAARIDLDKLIDNKLSEQERELIKNASTNLSRLPIIINDDTGTTISDIRIQARMNPDLKLIIVDFITLMQSSKKYENRNLEVGALSRELKNLASELNIPIIALAQLKRGKTADQQPSLEDLRDSGELEQNANKVIFLWEIDKVNGKIGVSVAKNRRGKTGSVVMRFIGEHMRYIETQESPPKKRYNKSGLNEVFGEGVMDG